MKVCMHFKVFPIKEMFSLYISEVPVDGLDYHDLVPVGSDQRGRAGALNEEPFVDGLVEEGRKSVLWHHMHQCRRHRILLWVIHLRSLSEFAKGNYDENLDVIVVSHIYVQCNLFLLSFYCLALWSAIWQLMYIHTVFLLTLCRRSAW